MHVHTYAYICIHTHTIAYTWHIFFLEASPPGAAADADAAGAEAAAAGSEAACSEAPVAEDREAAAAELFGGLAD